MAGVVVALVKGRLEAVGTSVCLSGWGACMSVCCHRRDLVNVRDVARFCVGAVCFPVRFFPRFFVVFLRVACAASFLVHT